MALTPQEADNLRKMLLEIERLSKALKQNVDTTNLQDLEKSADNIKFIFEKLNKEFKEQNDEISYAAVGFKRIVQEISNANIGLRESNKIYNNLSSLASQIQSHQQGISELSSKELANKKKKAELARLELENAQELLKDKEKEQKSELENLENLKKAKEKHLERLKNQHASQSLIDKYQKTIDAIYEKEEKQGELLRKTQGLLKENASILENQNELYKGLLKTIDEETQKAKNLEKALGLSGAAIDGIGKALNKAGLGSLADQMGLDEDKEKMKEVAHQVTKGGTKSAGLVGQFKILKAGIGSLGGSIMKNLTDPLVMAGLAAKAVSAGVGLIKKGFSLLKGGVSSVVGFVKNLWGMADQFAAVFEKYAKAGQFAAQNFSAVGGQVNAIRNSLNAAAAADPFMRVAEAGPALKAITDGTGLFASQMTKSVKDAHDLSYWLGYSAEETGKLERLGITQNKSSKEVLENIKVQGALLNSKYKTSVSQRLIEQTALKASAAVTFNLKQNPKALAEAAYQATKLNMTLDEIASAAEQTLDFESSIQNQLEYQALTGREINIDAYQQAALRGDTVAAAKELDKILQSQGAAIEGNVLNQEALAKTLGISKDKLLEARSQQLLVNKFGADRIDIEKTLQGLMDKHNISREEAAKRMTKADISNQLAASKRAEAMSRALEDFRDYMATRLWPLFKAVFSPANIKMFMTAINGMRPVFVELGKAITAFFSPDSAGAMSDVLKNDIMPAILDLAKMLTEVAGGAGKTLFALIKSLGPVIKKDVIPIVKYLASIIQEIAPTVGTLIKALAGGVAGVLKKINENKEEIKSFIETLAKGVTKLFGFITDHLKEIAITFVAFKALTAARSLKSAVLGAPGGSRVNAMWIRSADGIPGGGKGEGGGIMDKIKGFFGKGGKAAGAAGATTGVTGGVAGATSFADKRKMVLARQAAGEGLGSKASSVTAGAKGAAGAAGSGMAAAGGAAPGAVPVPEGADKAGGKLSKFGSTMGKAAGGLLKASAALVLIAGSLYIAAKAFQEFALVDWEDIGKGTVALLALGGAVFALSKLLGKGDVLVASAAMVIMAGSLWIMADAMNKFATVKAEDLGIAAGALVLLTGAVLGLGAAMASGIGAAVFLAGVAALVAMGGALYVVAGGLDALIKVAGGGKLETLGVELNKGITSLTTNLADADFDKLEDIFEEIEDAFDELDIDELLAFSELAGASLAGAAQNLVAGIQELATLDLKGEALDKSMITGFSSKLAEYFDQLEDVFDEVEDAIDELDIDALLQFSELANVSIVGAVRNLARGMSEMEKIKINGKSNEAVIASLASIELIADEFEDVLGELDFSQLTEFGQIAKVGLVSAVTTLKLGIDEFTKQLGGLVIDGDKLDATRKSFHKLAQVFGSLGIDNIVKFAELSKGGLEEAATKLKTAIETLGNMTFDISEENTEKIKTAFRILSTSFTAAGLDNIIKFAELSKGNLVGAGDNLKAGIEHFAKLSINVTSEQLQPVVTSFQAFDNAIGSLQMENILKFAELAKSNLVNAATNFKNGVDALNTVASTVKEGDYNNIVNLKEPIEKLSEAFQGDSKVFENLSNFAKMELGDIKAKIGKFKEALDELNALGGSYDFGDANTPKNPFENLQNVFTELNIAFGSDMSGITSFLGTNFSDLDKSVDGFIKGVKKLSSTDEKTGLGKMDLTSFKQLLTDLNTSFAGLDLTSFEKFAELKLDKFPASMTSLKKGMDNINKVTINKVISDLINLLPQLHTQLTNIANFDPAKFVSLAEAIVTLSDSFKVLAETITSMGDVTPIVKVSDQMLKLHESVSKNPMDAEKLAEGVGAIFSGLMGSLVSFVEGGGQGVSNSFFGGVKKVKDGIVQAQDGELNLNGGPVVSTFQKGQLTPVMQGIKEDNVYLTTNKPQSSPTSGGTVVDNSAVIAAINRLTEVMASSTDKKIVVDVKSDIPTFVSKVRQTSFGG